MSLVHSFHPCESIVVRYESFREKALGTLDPGVVRAGSRIAASVGYVAHLAFAQPSATGAVVAGIVAVVAGAGLPILLKGFCSERSEMRGASAVVVNVASFADLEDAYGLGSGDHAFRLLRRAMEAEASDGDPVVQMDGAELVLLLDDYHPAHAKAAIRRIESRFARALRDAGYDCDLSLGLADEPSRTRNGVSTAFRRFVSPN